MSKIIEKLIRSRFRLKLLCFFILLLLNYCIYAWIQDSKVPLYIIPRYEWGATYATAPCQKHTPNKILIHHSGRVYNRRYPAGQYVKDIQKFHQERKRWADIAYHFLIDQTGLIYEGRPIDCIGDSGTEYDKAGYVLICLLGDYNLQKPSSRQLKSLVNLIAYLCYKYKINPQDIVSHRDVARTSCPGRYLCKFIKKGDLPLMVQRKLNVYTYKERQGN